MNWISIQGAFRDGKHMPSIYLCIHSLATYMYIFEYKLVSSTTFAHQNNQGTQEIMFVFILWKLFSKYITGETFQFSLNQVLINYSKSKFWLFLCLTWRSLMIRIPSHGDQAAWTPLWQTFNLHTFAADCVIYLTRMQNSDWSPPG